MNQPLLCLTLTGRTLEEDLQLIRKYEQYIDIVELRVDYLNEDEQLYIRRFPSMIYQPCILTIRRDIDGGQFTSGEFSRTNLFGRALAFANPERERNFAYVDFEDDYHIPSIQDAAMAFGVKIIRSMTNLSGPIYNIRNACESLRKTGYEIPKIIFKSKSLKDTANLFFETENLQKFEHITCCIGYGGITSRILASRTNSLLAYVYPNDFETNIYHPDHLDPVLLSNVYNFKSINEKTDLYGAAGFPLDRPFSPEFINKGFKNCDKNAVLVPIRSENLQDVMDFSERLDLRGLVMGYPHQENIVYSLYEQSYEVAATGCCNTIIRKNNRLAGFNTSVFGFKKALEEFLGETRIKWKKVAIIGAGSMAKTVAFVLKQMGAKVCIFNRTEAHARQLADRYGFNYCHLDSSCIELLDEYSTLIIQTTYLGMNSTEPSNEENDPISFYNFRGNELLFDTVYSPGVTPVMRRASLAGCRTCNGIKMKEYETGLQFRLFTGNEYIKN